MGKNDATLSRSQKRKYSPSAEENETRIQYHKTANHDVKISKFDQIKQIPQEIDSTLEQRRSNRLRNNHVKDILNKGYKLKTYIGHGSYAHVFRVRDLRFNRDVAIKLIELDKCSKHYKEVCLRNEIYVIRELDHENIVKFFEAFNTTMAYIMVMELVENGTFADYLRKNGALSEEQTRKLFRGVFNGVEYMHKRLIAHRDLKLENLMLTKSMEPKIVDFSLSLIWDGKHLVSDWCGTPPYFAPEILQRKPYNPLGSDVWSLGVCVYIMLNDTLPFIGQDDQETLQKQLNRDWKFRTKYERFIGEDLKQIIRSMLEPDIYMRIRINELIQLKF
ncbi:Testis-specific serine/threonine-protein kinase 3 [Sarcoptes scabiei]|uniref:Protein tyrosine kinase-like protein 2 n=1 Tax=Sarcoptes scabiei TaxID=52283 RepID=A0A132ALH7_SARSC|nr:Testis-specific serine/threonine-protein kinase 3 [Sarcoptes scabiei]KPM11821.1 Protein tyrosine kinase-like protein 2 [Sarcoptes scabiei]